MDSVYRLFKITYKKYMLTLYANIDIIYFKLEKGMSKESMESKIQKRIASEKAEKRKTLKEPKVKEEPKPIPNKNNIGFLIVLGIIVLILIAGVVVL